MSPRVSISLKAARAILEEHELEAAPPDFAVGELEAAIAKATRASATRRKLRKPKEDKRKAKREETAVVRETVMARAHGLCECCGYQPASTSLELDHFWGRGKAKQAVENCWALCHLCHRQKTSNEPSANDWLRAFAEHCATYGYEADWAKAEARIHFNRAAEVLRGDP